MTLPDLATGAGKKLMAGIIKSWTPVSSSEVENSAKNWLHATRNSIYAFSAAKSYAQLAEMRDLLFGSDGKAVSFSAFRKSALAIHEKYNELWLEAEYDAAVRSSIMARNWQDIQANKDIFPYLTYKTAGDDRVRISHKALDGITLSVNDAFWKTYYPPNGWGCRCDVIPQQEVTAETPLLKGKAKKLLIAEAQKATPKYWQRNVGDSDIFPESDTAYFEAMPAKKLEAVRHYGLKDAGYLMRKGAAETWTDGTNTIKVTMQNGEADILILDSTGNRVNGLTTVKQSEVENHRQGILIEK